ncbi:MAG: alpha/beta fold hydrolase [Acidimicrobiales bacterium]
MDAVTKRTIAGDGTVIGCRVNGKGPALLLVHSTAADARQWARLAPLLAPSFTVIAMDRRGRGLSGPFQPSHSLDVEYGDIAAVATSIGGPVHLFGHSSGAQYALHAAGHIPNLASLMLYEPPEPRVLPDRMIEPLARLEASADRLGLLRLFFVEVVGNGEDDFASLQQRPIWSLMLDNALTLPDELRAGREYRFDPSEHAGLSIPVLLLVGGFSGPELVATVQRIADAVPSSKVVTLPGQGHGAMFSAPELLASEIRRFADSATSEPRSR